MFRSIACAPTERKVTTLPAIGATLCTSSDRLSLLLTYTPQVRQRILALAAIAREAERRAAPDGTQARHLEHQARRMVRAFLSEKWGAQ